MKFLSSGFGIAILAMIAHLGTLAGLLLPGLKNLKEPETIAHLPQKTALPPRLWSFKTEAVDLLITELESERAKLVTDQKSIMSLQSQTASERAELDKVRDEIRAMRAEIDTRIAELEERKQKELIEIEERELKNLKSLSQTYSAMNPPQVVIIFREMEENTVVKILSIMKTTTVGPILAEMAKSPDRGEGESMAKRAARITDKLRLLKSLKKENA